MRLVLPRNPASNSGCPTARWDTPIRVMIEAMIRHVVLLTANSGTPVTQLEHIVDELRTLPASIPELLDYRVGLDLGLAADNASIAVTADFDDIDGWATYRDHPDHVRIIDELIKPVLATRTAAQYEFTSTTV